MAIKEEQPNYIGNTPLAVQIMNVQHYEAHRHSAAVEFLHCFSGSATAVIAHETIPLRQGELVAVEHENVHAVYSDEDNLLMSVHLDLTRIPYPWEEIQYVFFSCATRMCRPHQRSAMEQIYDLLIGIAFLYAEKDRYPHSCYQQIANILAQVFIENFCWFSIEELTSEENDKFRGRLNRIITYIQQNYKEKITIAQLAKREYINENYFSQFLKRTPFHSFTLMVQYVRCYEAEKLLLDTNLSVQEISDCCGFSSKKYFHKYFKHYWQTSPLQHKKWHQRYALNANVFKVYRPEEILPTIKTYLSERHVTKILHLSLH